MLIFTLTIAAAFFIGRGLLRSLSCGEPVPHGEVAGAK